MHVLLAHLHARRVALVPNTHARFTPTRTRALEVVHPQQHEYFFDGLSSASEVRAKARAIDRILEILHNKPAECVDSTHSRDDPVEVRATALAMTLVSCLVHSTRPQRAQHVAATQDGRDNGHCSTPVPAFTCSPTWPTPTVHVGPS
jgi:hypothetical protein